MKNNIQLLERAQRRSLKLVQVKNHLDYIRKRQILNIPSISLRLNSAVLILGYKLLTNHVPGHRQEEFFKTSTKTSLRGHHFKLDHQRAVFSQGVVNTVVNKRPMDVVAALAVGFLYKETRLVPAEVDAELWIQKIFWNLEFHSRTRYCSISTLLVSMSCHGRSVHLEHAI